MLVRTFVFAALITLPLAEVRAQDENPVVTLAKTKVKDKSKPFTMMVMLKVKAGQEKALVDAFTPCIAASRKEAGCKAYALNRDIDDPRQFVVYETYTNLEALESHAKTKHVTELFGKLGAMLDGAPAVKVYVPVGE
jgi:quinol monooxygenase YgiN